MTAWYQAFTQSRGPRAVAPEEYDRLEALKTYFGSEPPKTDVPGGMVSFNSRAFRYWAAYQTLVRDFGSILDESFLSERELERIIDTTGGVPIFWKSKSGTPYMALDGVEYLREPIYRFPNLFGKPNVGDPIAILWLSILAKGGVIAFPADIPGSSDGWNNVSAPLRRKNEENIKALQALGLLPIPTP